MKIPPALLFPVLALLVLLGTFLSIKSFGPDSNQDFDPSNITEFRKMKNRMISSSVGAPFYRVSGFDSLRYFPPNKDQVYLADFQPIRDGELLDLMPDMPGFPSHAVAGFAVLEKNGRADTLYILKSLHEKSDSVFFAPFNDKSNGRETYGGGRYLDLIIRRGRPVLLDFNYASNPYCAYKADFVCPLVPEFNHISWEIKAGEMTYPDNNNSH